MNHDEHTQEPPPDLSRSERIFLRLSIWQTVLSVAGVFIAVVALHAALTESEAVRRQTAAAVWPYVQLTVNDYITSDDAMFELSLTNAGVGPTRIGDMRVTFGGRTMTTWGEVAASVGIDAGAFSQTVANNRVIRPGESVVIFGARDRDAVRALRAAVSNAHNAIEYCYCSIFDECWLADSRLPDATPEPVKRCPDYGAASFAN
ncbi:MAG TPA: hypothetical protein PLN53_07285 [Terricaulis sp.]|nr:hypothetical protein [Terricaulis sp.]